MAHLTTCLNRPPPELCSAGGDGHPDADPQHGHGHEGADAQGGLPHQRDHDPHGPPQGDRTGILFSAVLQFTDQLRENLNGCGLWGSTGLG